MSMNAGDIVFYIKGDDSQLELTLKNIDKQFSQVSKSVGLGMMAMGGMITGALGIGVNAAVEWESAFIGVKKTTNATTEQFKELEQGIIDLSLEVPVAATELAKLAEIGGQMGVPRENLLAFTKTMAILGETTNIAGEEGAAMLAQFANVAQVPQSEYSNLAAAIVDLGNAGSSTEYEILAMGQRIAGAGAVAGMSAGDILGFANALVGVGIEAQAGGTAMSKLIIGIAGSVAQGGKSVEAFAKIAGMSAKQFTEAFQKDPAQAIASFIQGLARIKAEGGNLFGVLNALGIKESIMRDVMLRATLAADDMAASVQLGNKAFEQNNAHLVEAEKRFASTESKIQLFDNSVKALSITLTDTLKNSLADRMVMFSEWAKDVLAVARAHPELVAQLIQFAGALGLGLVAVGALLTALPGISIALGAITLPAMAAWTGIAALIGVLAAAAYAAYEWARAWLAVPENLAVVNAAIDAAGQWIAGAWDWIVGVFRTAVNWVGGLLDQFVGWARANWGQIIQIFENAKTGLLLIGGMLWEGLQLGFSLLWEFLSRVFGEIGEGFIDASGVAQDGSATWLDAVQAMQEKTIRFLEVLSRGFENFTDFIYYIWPLIGAGMELGANLFIEPVMNMLDAFYWILDQVTWVFGKLQGMWSWIAGDSGFAGGVNIPGPPGLATGGAVSRGGWAMVGERGPELVRLPQGATVYDNQQTQAATGGGDNYYITIHSAATDAAGLSRDLAREISLNLRGRGI